MIQKKQRFQVFLILLAGTTILQLSRAQCDSSCVSCHNGNSCITCAKGYGRMANGGIGSCFKCPKGQYSNGQGYCTDCAPHCAECTDGLSCTECIAPFSVNKVGYCIKCGSGSFYNTNAMSCYGCPEGCSECLNENYCSSCRPGAGKGFDPTIPEVCGRCKSGQYLEGQQCKPCVKNCDNCNNPFTCSVCNSPWMVSSEGKNKDKCVFNCGSEKWFDYPSDTCQACPANCRDCKDGRTCNWCNNGFARDRRNSGSCFRCKKGTFLTASQTCERCSANCATCGSASKCYQCKAPFNVDVNGACTICPEGSYFDKKSKTCNKCHDSCDRCKTGDSCSSCAKGYLSHKLTISPSLCVKCTGANYLEGNVCKPCSNYCLSCSTSRCDVCAAPTLLDADGDCIVCNSDQFFDEKIKRCVQCGPMSTMCKSLSVDTECMVGAYLNQATKTCTKCMNDCASCSGDGQACDTCTEGLGRRTDLDAARCYKCTAEQYLTGDQQCVQCSEHCVDCFSASFCNKCEDPFLSDVNGRCITCGSREYFDSEARVCKPCHKSCKTCSSGAGCDACQSGYVTRSNTISPSFCVECTGANYLDGNRCLKCSKDCNQCRSGSQCDKCTAGTLLNADGVCVVCKKDEYFDMMNERCTKCLPLATTCSARLAHTGCVKGAWLDKSTSQCAVCPSDCASCTDGQACDSCKAGLGRRLDLDPTRCYKCTAEQFLTNVTKDKECKTCSTYCINCGSSTKCTTCEAPYRSDVNGKCVKCEAGEYFDETSKVCSSCHKSCATCTRGDACASCNNGYLSRQLTISPSLCVKCTGSNWLSGNTCEACSKNCVRCAFGSACQQCKAPSLLNVEGQCVICKSDEFFDTNARMCTKCGPLTTECANIKKHQKCVEGAFLNPASNLCEECQSDCQSCSDGISCDKCKGGLGRRADLDNKRCYKCTAEQFLTGEQDCTMCSTNCESCSDATTCGKCKAGWNPNANGKCVKCEAGSYFHQTMKMCMTCHESCETCADGESCGKCSAGYLSSSLTISRALCIKCTGSFWLDGNQCKACSPNCKKCPNGSSCAQCNEGFQLDVNERCITCEKGRYFDKFTRTCEKCNSLCTACNTKDTCTECRSGAALDPVSSQCKTCPFDCATCADQDTCTSCRDGFGRRADSDPKRCYKCSAGQFLTNEQCKSCSSNCVGCKDANTCTYCQAPYKLGAGGDCIKCTGATFYETGSKRCQNCAWNCEKCTDKVSCNRCQSGFAMAFSLNNKDVCQKCPRGQYASSFALGQKCEGCQANCAACNNGDVCQVCATGFELSATGQCIACGDGTFYDRESMTCKKCDSTCATCSGPDKCESCSKGLGWFEGSKFCVKCHKGTYLEDQICKGCEGNCLECSSGTQCNKCRGSFKVDYTGLCVDGKCGTGKYFDEVSSKKCEHCRTHCASCNHENNCLTCKPGFGKYSFGRADGFCYQCGIEEYLDGQICRQCAKNCARCTGESTCTHCKDPTALNEDGQCELCPVGTFFNRGVCTECKAGCASCSDGSTCDTCTEGFGRLFPDQDVCVKPMPGAFLMPTISEIKSCKENCATCSDGSTCDTCKDSFLFTARNQCVTCATNEFFDAPVTRECQSCSNNCGSCDRSNSCKTCDGGFGFSSKGRNSNLCYECAPDQYLVGQTCHDCGFNCKTCKDRDTCMVCLPDYNVDETGSCVMCGEGQFFNLNNRRCEINTAQMLQQHEATVSAFSYWPVIILVAALLLALLIGLLIYCCCCKRNQNNRGSQDDGPLERGVGSGDVIPERRRSINGEKLMRDKNVSGRRVVEDEDNSQIPFFNKSRSVSFSANDMTPGGSPKVIREVNLSASPKRLSASPSRQNSFGGAPQSPARSSRRTNRSAVSGIHESESSEGNPALNHIQLPDHDQAASFPNERRAGARRGDSPHYSIRYRRDVNRSQSPVIRGGSPGSARSAQKLALVPIDDHRPGIALNEIQPIINGDKEQ